MDDTSRYASQVLHWPTTVTNLAPKTRAADHVATLAMDGDVIGIGSGSAAYLSLWAIGRRVEEENLDVAVIPTSYETEIAASTLGLSMARLGQVIPAWAVDGADEVDPAGRVLKGRGGALFKEKMLWHSSPRIVLVIDSSKRVDHLGTRFPLPIEVHPNAVEPVSRFLHSHGCSDASVRTSDGKDGPVITELGCFILDATFDVIPVGFHALVKQLPGVIETGLFEGFDFQIIDDTNADEHPQ